MPNTILVVDDHSFVRRGIIALIQQEADLMCCGEADSVANTPRLVSELNPDLLLLDIRLSDGDSFPLIRLLAEQRPKLPILVLSQFCEPSFAERALRSGAMGYVAKQDAAHCVVEAIRAVLAGYEYLSPSLSIPDASTAQHNPALAKPAPIQPKPRRPLR